MCAGGRRSAKSGANLSLSTAQGEAGGAREAGGGDGTKEEEEEEEEEEEGMVAIGVWPTSVKRFRR